MGLLSKGTPLEWSEATKYKEMVKANGITQFINLYHKLKDRTSDVLLWGDEIEYMVITFLDDKVLLDLDAFQILSTLQSLELDLKKNNIPTLTCWHPEYARYMIEATPGIPYGSTLQDLLKVQENMKLRRTTVEQMLSENQHLVTLTNFPLLGTKRFLHPHYEPNGDASKSLFIPDEAISEHARFKTLTKNIRTRRGRKVDIQIPIFKDKNTPDPFIDQLPKSNHVEKVEENPVQKDCIYMDCMCFGMGCSCLQITFQACNIIEARMLYDQLAVISPLMLCLTAATPIFKGYLADVDCRWNIISKSVDDRTKEELGLTPLNKDKFVINKSRYDSIDSYISLDSSFKKEYNDIPLVFDQSICDKLQANGIGVDELLARHIAHLYIRDPLVLYRELLDLDNEQSSDHFENIQSTNWQTVRFKPPPANSDIGWRVEFRSMEIQLTEFENAAFAVFIVLLTRTILSLGLNFYIPISKVDENLQKAQKRNAVMTEKFLFRKNVFPKNNGSNHDHKSSNGLNSKMGSTEDNKSRRISELVLEKYGSPTPASNMNSYFEKKERNGGIPNETIHSVENEDEYVYLTMNEIMNGEDSDLTNDTNFSTSTSNNVSKFPGLIPLINSYIISMDLDVETRCKLTNYLRLIKSRSNGTCMTAASYFRKFVQNHESYKGDSVVSEIIGRDLCKEVVEITSGKKKPVELFGNK